MEMGNQPELIRASIVARHRKYLYPMSLRSIELACQTGMFKTAVKLGFGKKAHWWIHSGEVLQHKLRRHAVQTQE